MGNTIKLDYVASALGWGIFPYTGIINHPLKNLYKDSILGIGSILNRKIAENCKLSESFASYLFNAYSESTMINVIEQMEKGGMGTVYSDSGGLQVITTKSVIDEKTKMDVYDIQARTDLAMCFDEIPLKYTSNQRTMNERSFVGNKVFDFERLKECAELTGKNVKKQIEFFRNRGTKTKVILIAHGNSSETMLEFYNYMVDQLSEEDYDYVGGLAITKTSMGRGVAEVVEILKAAKNISEFCHPAVTKQLHFLASGSLSKMRMLLHLYRSGYLTKYEKFSYDSSTLTCTYDYGHANLTTGVISLGQTKTNRALEYFSKVYDMFKDEMGKLLTFDRLMDIIYGDDGDWKYSTVKKRCFALKSDRESVGGLLIKTIHTYYQIYDFIIALEKILKNPNYLCYNGSSKEVLLDLSINNLRKVKDDYELSKWMNDVSTTISTDRIESQVNSLEGFFE